MFIIPICSNAQTISTQDNNLIDEYLRAKMISKKTIIGPVAVNKVFSGNFYTANPGYVTTDGESYASDMHFNINGGVIIQYEELSTDKELPVLLALVKKGFLLKDASGAKLFEDALNELFPVKENEKKDIKHLKKANQWIFLRNKFFDDQTAIIVTTAPDGTISRLEVLLGYKVS